VDIPSIRLMEVLYFFKFLMFAVTDILLRREKIRNYFEKYLGYLTADIPSIK